MIILIGLISRALVLANSDAVLIIFSIIVAQLNNSSEHISKAYAMPIPPSEKFPADRTAHFPDY